MRSCLDCIAIATLKRLIVTKWYLDDDLKKIRMQRISGSKEELLLLPYGTIKGSRPKGNTLAHVHLANITIVQTTFHSHI